MTTITIQRRATVRNGKIEIDVPELKEGFIGKLTVLVEEEPEPSEPFAWIDVAQKISDSGVTSDLPADYSATHKKRKVRE